MLGGLGELFSRTSCLCPSPYYINSTQIRFGYICCTKTPINLCLWRIIYMPLLLERKRKIDMKTGIMRSNLCPSLRPSLSSSFFLSLSLYLSLSRSLSLDSYLDISISIYLSTYLLSLSPPLPSLHISISLFLF